MVTPMPDRQRRDPPLREYRRKRNPARTPEPVPPEPVPDDASSDRAAADEGRSPGATTGDRFVVQEHHARALHWDLRLERDGVLVSWAVPKGLPPDPATNHLAVHTEDHPLEYATFAGDIPAGEYGGGRMSIWDRGRYDTEKWTHREVKVVLHGERVQGRYVLFATGGKNWMIHRMDPPTRPDWKPLPDVVRPMLAVRGSLPEDDAAWAFETGWDGERTMAYVEGGRVRALDGDDRDVTRGYPELRALGEALGTTQVVLDGELVALDGGGRPSPDELGERVEAAHGGTLDSAAGRRLVARVPLTYLVFDLLHLDGTPMIDEPYTRRRELLDRLGPAGPSWRVTPSFPGGGADVLAAAREHGLPAVVAKRLAAPYRPGRRSRDWRRISARRVAARRSP
jgi:bifunctional non-homologous end joining protein LigD